MRKRQIERWTAAHTFASERLVYRPLRPADVRAVLGNYDEEVHRRQGWVEAPYDRHRYERQVRRPDLAACAPHLVVCTPDGAVIGDYSVQPGRGPTEVGLGWSFGPAGRGRGFGAESLPVVLEYLHRYVGVPRVAMGTAADNRRARRQIAAAGALPDADAEPRHTLPNGAVVAACWFVRLLGLGSSAGLNLNLDRFRYEAGDLAFGPADAPVRFVDDWSPGVPPLDAPLEVVARLGLDRDPIDGTPSPSAASSTSGS